MGANTEACQRPRRSTLTKVDKRNIYHKECNFWQKYRAKRKQKHQAPVTITTHQAELTLKQAAEANDNQSLWCKIKDVDRIAKEFKYHEFCDKEYTRKQKCNQTVVDENDGSMGDSQSVVQWVNERVLGQNQNVSMEVRILNKICVLLPGDTGVS